MALEKPSNWVQSGKETKEAQTYMQKLKELKKDVFAKLDRDVKAKNIARKDFEMKEYTVTKGDTLGGILKNKIAPFKNNDVLLYSLTYMNVDRGANINVINANEKVKVENGVLKITSAKGQVRLAVDLIPWGLTVTAAAPLPKDTVDTGDTGYSTDTGNNLPYNKGRTLPDPDEN